MRLQITLCVNGLAYHFHEPASFLLDIVASVTRLGDLFDFGQLFKAFGQQLICTNLPHY